MRVFDVKQMGLGQGFIQEQQFKPEARMGGSESTSSNAMDHFSKRFIRSAHPADPEETSLFLLHERLSENKFALRIVATNDLDQKARVEELICKKLAMNKIVRQKKCLTPIDHYLVQENRGYCNIAHQAYILFELTGAETLTHYLSRGYYNSSMQKTLDERTICEGLLNLVAAVSLLKHYKQPHESINCDTVYYNEKQKKFILCDPWMILNPQQQYYSPEKLKQIRNEVEKQDPYISDVFSIGIVGLKALGISGLTEAYNYPKKTLNLAKIHEATSKIKGSQLRGLLSRLLGSIAAREQLLQQHKFYDNDLDPSVKPRHLSGKVSSVRKSFQNSNRPIARLMPESQIQNEPTYIQSQMMKQQGRFIPFTRKPDGDFQLGNTDRNFLKKNINFETRDTLPPFSPPPMEIVNIGNIEQASQSSLNSQPDIKIPINPNLNNVGVNKVQIGATRWTTGLDPYERGSIGIQRDYGHKISNPVSSGGVSFYHHSSDLSSGKEIQPFRTSTPPRDSASGETDNQYQHKILQSLKQLQDKVSEAIGNSRKNIGGQIPISEKPEVLQSPLPQIERQKKEGERQIEKIVPVEKKKEDQKIVDGENRSIQQQKIEEGDVEKEKSERETQQLNNQTKQRDGANKQEKTQLQNDEIREEVTVDALKTPNKSNSMSRFEEINNQTIPEQSEEQSVDQMASQPNGEFVEEIYENGGKYVGYMRDGQRNGQGIFYYRDGGYYDGHWKKNMMNGYGKLFYETGRLAYEGQWYRDQFHGRGKVYNDAPQTITDCYDYTNMNDTEGCWEFYEGDLSHDTKAGKGKLMLSNGQFYEGEFRGDQVHGQGTFHPMRGGPVKGIWEQGFFIRQL